MTSDLYKSKGIHSKEYLQSERRHALLELQRQRRNELLDQHRSIEPLKKVWKKVIHRRHQTQHNEKNFAIKNQIMLSEWLKEVPDDIDNWYIKPCPKGTRVLVIAANGITRAFNKYGAFMRRFHTEFPGDSRHQQNAMTILDCIYVPNANEYFVLDILAYGCQSFIDCEADFRFFWLESQMHESNVAQITESNECVFHVVEKVRCCNELAFNQLFTMFPIWPNNQPELDGFLFYHKEASYVHGQTPLVGWLFAFMIPELFNVPSINEHYFNDKPANYTNYMDYIKQFDEDLFNRRKMRKSKNNIKHHMDEEEQQSNDENNDEKVFDDEFENACDQTDPITILNETMELETNG